MKTFQFAQTKRYFWIKSEDQTFCCKISGGAWQPTELIGASNWHPVEADSIDEAMNKAMSHKVRHAEERSAALAAAMQKLDADVKEMIAAGPIPATIENITTIAKWLNTQNWGVWSLPEMTIGYTAHQYDCDGKQATTITLYQPVGGHTKYVVGAPNGHLTGYTRLR